MCQILCSSAFFLLDFTRILSKHHLTPHHFLLLDPSSSVLNTRPLNSHLLLNSEILFFSSHWSRQASCFADHRYFSGKNKPCPPQTFWFPMNKNASVNQPVTKRERKHHQIHLTPSTPYGSKIESNYIYLCSKYSTKGCPTYQESSVKYKFSTVQLALRLPGAEHQKLISASATSSAFQTKA